MNVQTFKYARLCGQLLILTAAIVFVIAGLFLRNSIEFKSRAVEITGIVKSIESEKSDVETMYFPVFLFTDHVGQEHQIRSSLGSYPPEYKIHDEIQILYDPASPEEAKISSFWSLYAAGTILGIGGLMNLIMGLVFLFVVPLMQNIMAEKEKKYAKDCK